MKILEMQVELWKPSKYEIYVMRRQKKRQTEVSVNEKWSSAKMFDRCAFRAGQIGRGECRSSSCRSAAAALCDFRFSGGTSSTFWMSRRSLSVRRLFESSFIFFVRQHSSFIANWVGLSASSWVSTTNTFLHRIYAFFTLVDHQFGIIAKKWFVYQIFFWL